MPEPDLPPPLKAFVAAVNAGDTEAAFSLFAPDAEINDWGRRFTTASAMRAWSDREFIGAKGRLSVTKVIGDGDRFVVDAGWKSKVYSGDSRFVFTLRHGAIREMRIGDA